MAFPPESPAEAPERELGDFTATPDLVRLAAICAAIGAVVAVVALGLLDLIALITNLAYAGRWSTTFTPPDPSLLGPWSVLVPVAGGIVIGLMARFGSERIRGHGIPEAIETILLRGSRMEPRLTVLKPLSSAISIGTGGPFGAEGPIIVTGGAIGSVTGQFLHLTAAERRSLLVAGAAGGMTAVFGTPVAAVLLAVELLAFEWRPRSLVPAAVAASTAAVVRGGLADAGLIHPTPLFPMPAVADFPATAVAGAAAIGLACAGLAWILTRAVYASEDGFARLPLHWCWWPAIGGVVVGVGGLIEPRVLGAGYATIDDELAGRLALGALATILLCKLVVWSIALGSGTSGGILAPLLMMGAALGGVAGSALPGADPGAWALIGMAATMAAAMRSPLTAIVFALELTHQVGALLPLLAACGVAQLASVLGLRRDLLTERIARRGHHVNREYQVDPLQALFVREAMDTDCRTVPAETTIAEVYDGLPEGSERRRQRLYPVLGRDGRMVGVLALSDVLGARAGSDPGTAGSLARRPIVAYPDETLLAIANRMVASGFGVLPVVAREDSGWLLGIITQFHLLSAHRRVLVEEGLRDRPLRPGLRPVSGGVPSKHRNAMFLRRCSMARTSALDITVVGYQVRSTDGAAVIGEVEGVRPHGIRIHNLPGHRGRAGYLPDEMVGRVNRPANTLFLVAGIGVEQVVNAPPPPDESPDGWHKSTDWWADLLGHYGLFASEGRGSEPFLHPDQR